ncbi:MAG: bifunctional [glutamate--ammonia ligase]-adenylyl-L-tyrosine phosphorylase/[glutamate--ammonia-ligase] adenylyltransferase [Gammaproteobacteria bacterium]|nr:bifunctional [glutamate--ammonia ligase]-adenylyl-L-tyrosine phosphorylase/[glutamate--ammonia-ligase] adenylyltransferase [Gammaproteobacteria bacterium]
MNLHEELAEEYRKNWHEWCEALADRSLPCDLNGQLRQQLQRVWEGSDYVAQHCIRDPQMLADLAGRGDLERSYQQGELRSRLQQRLEGVDSETDLQRRLRLFRREQMVRIIWRDLAGSAGLGETLEELSELADVAVDQALSHLYAWAVARQGVPRDEAGEQQTLLVLAMGKLGARELNLSSDIDLIFTYPRQGSVAGSRPISNEQFFIRLCQQLIKTLSAQTADGFVFRVDARLRPFGDSGPLAICFDAMEDYYESHAREWERYAMIKARVVAGDREAGDHLMNVLRPFVYRRYLDFGAIESIREMKRLIGRELMRKGIADNIKLGPGGIREIEFIGQAYQLIRGGHDPKLQIRPILKVLALLRERKLIPAPDVSCLMEAYEFLRLVENRLQAWQDRQTHLLPEGELARLRLARSMGFEDWAGFFGRLERHRKRVQESFDKVFAAPHAEEDQADQRLRAVWELQVDGEQAEEFLRLAGFRQGDEALVRLEGFRGSHAYRGLGIRGRQRLDQLMPLLLAAVSASPQPEVTLTRLLRLLEAITRRTAYLALLVESPMALSQLVRLAGISPWIATQITRFPLLLDELLDPRRLYSPLKSADLHEELETLLSAVDADDHERQLDRMRQFANSNKLRVAAADITGMIPLMVVSDYLTDIAETLLARVLEYAWQDMRAKYGVPVDVLGEQKGFAVIGYGKLGGIELGYGSDLDMVFLHGSSNANAVTDGKRQIANDVFYMRLGQRVIHMITARTASGVLYETDMRLRPNGNSGMLVSSLDAFERYQREDAWTWEHQALLRARFVTGDPLVGERFRQIRREVLGRQREAEKLRAEVREMREKMRTALDKSGGNGFDLKQGVGGIADIEFMVQYLILRWAFKFPALLKWTDNIRLLDSLAEHQLLPAEITQRLSTVYRTLRATFHRNALGELPGLIGHEEMKEERELVRRQWQRLMVDGGD